MRGQCQLYSLAVISRFQKVLDDRKQFADLCFLFCHAKRYTASGHFPVEIVCALIH